MELRGIIRERRKQYQYLFESCCHEINFLPIVKTLIWYKKSGFLNPSFCDINSNSFFQFKSQGRLGEHIQHAYYQNTAYHITCCNKYLIMSSATKTSAPWGKNSARLIKNWLAILCSYPFPIKANRHQNIIINFAVSSSLWLTIHPKRYTSQLHIISRKKASLVPNDIFIATP